MAFRSKASFKGKSFMEDGIKYRQNKLERCSLWSVYGNALYSAQVSLHLRNSER